MQNAPSQASNQIEDEYDVQKIIDRITLLKNRLVEVSRRSNANINLAGNLLSGVSRMLNPLYFLFCFNS